MIIKKKELINWCEENKEDPEEAFFMRNRNHRQDDHRLYKSSGKGL